MRGVIGDGELRGVIGDGELRGVIGVDELVGGDFIAEELWWGGNGGSGLPVCDAARVWCRGCLWCGNGRCPPTVLGGTGFKVCSAVSYFSTRV
ncbi:hypothetical protein, partial [Mycolicibacterium poriferae]|uniref:hypothetical protein n=1 Tax=Mycolicibacterium poriferae TaxID=39694 RepID=UPI0024BAC5DB